MIAIQLLFNQNQGFRYVSSVYKDPALSACSPYDNGILTFHNSADKGWVEKAVKGFLCS